ncbi:RraA family protein [Cytobacillus sp. NCCP-133]|uniref:RraA family protein n=1 Tax=Cytobacillus sp. NCCP-133 TaxID=766848 RepID=UPI00222E4F9B|nr:RraA family protein [Cytobacillus sp. NCCP-133]GLB60908.1 S-adenosylmethionine--2-demethylmenaquinone methyltransferase [Cytobacillus sp. NCCP-133]
MLTIKERIQRYTTDEMAKFKTISTSTIGHFTDFGFISNFKCTVPVTKVHGEVITVKLSSGDGYPLNIALQHAKEGEILVIDTSGNKTHACWGEFRARKAVEIGLSAVIIDGAVADVEYLRHCRIPVFYETISPKTTRNLKLEGEVNTPVSVGGVVFESGDYIIADQDGIYKFNHLNYKMLMERAIDKEKKEKSRRLGIS